MAWNKIPAGNTPAQSNFLRKQLISGNTEYRRQSEVWVACIDLSDKIKLARDSPQGPGVLARPATVLGMIFVCLSAQLAA